jgi:hypothetical protein
MSAGNQLLFLSSEKGTFQTDVQGMKDVQWFTQNCKMGWPVQVRPPSAAPLPDPHT